MSFILDKNRIKLGVCYYPEHWPSDVWRSDLEKMLEAGLGVIRIAEFAWSKVEPEEGVFTYEFFDSFLDICEEKGMKVIFCTPTATPPAWLSYKYPEILNNDINGVQYKHGSRRHYNYNSPVYREKSRIITEKFAAHYAKRKCIIGWQLDNELNCETADFYSEADSVAFRKWVKDKYKTLEAVNQAWGTVFWNQTYTDFEQIFVPQSNCNNAQNPHRQLDYIRFVSDSAISFAREQEQIIRKYAKAGDFVTTNGLFGHLNNHEFTEKCLDFMMYDSYPNFSNRIDRVPSEEELGDRWWSKNLSEVRSISPIFGVMEQQTGANGWTIWDGVPSPRPGQIILWTLQSIAHGADFVSFFRWRTATFGTEMYWHGILDYSGRKNERLKEVTLLSNIVSRINSVAGKEYFAEAALLKDYDNCYDCDIDKWHRTLSEQSENAIFETCQRSHTPLNIEYFYSDDKMPNLDKYKVVFYPHAIISNPKRAEHLKKYVENGGTLILGARAGQKDMTGKCVTDKLPGVFSELTGADVFEYSFIQPDAKDTLKISMRGNPVSPSLFADRVKACDKAVVYGKYCGEYFDGDGACVRNAVGSGKAYYYGSSFSEEAVEFFLKKTGVKSPFASLIDVPECIELALRGDTLFILNYKNKAKKINLKDTVINLVSKETVKGNVTLPPYGVLIVKLP